MNSARSECSACGEVLRLKSGLALLAGLRFEFFVLNCPANEVRLEEKPDFNPSLGLNGAVFTPKEFRLTAQRLRAERATLGEQFNGSMYPNGVPPLIWHA